MIQGLQQGDQIAHNGDLTEWNEVYPDGGNRALLEGRDNRNGVRSRSHQHGHRALRIEHSQLDDSLAESGGLL